MNNILTIFEQNGKNVRQIYSHVIWYGYQIFYEQKYHFRIIGAGHLGHAGICAGCTLCSSARAAALATGPDSR